MFAGHPPAADCLLRNRDEAEGFREQLVAAAAVGVFVGHGGDHDFVDAGTASASCVRRSRTVAGEPTNERSRFCSTISQLVRRIRVIRGFLDRGKRPILPLRKRSSVSASGRASLFRARVGFRADHRDADQRLGLL